MEQLKIVTSKDLEIHQLKEGFAKEKEEMQKEVGVKILILEVIIQSFM